MRCPVVARARPEGSSVVATTPGMRGNNRVQLPPSRAIWLNCRLAVARVTSPEAVWMCSAAAETETDSARADLEPEVESSGPTQWDMIPAWCRAMCMRIDIPRAVG
jgi:hypothetical protein